MGMLRDERGRVGYDDGNTGVDEWRRTAKGRTGAGLWTEVRLCTAGVGRNNRPPEATTHGCWHAVPSGRDDRTDDTNQTPCCEFGQAKVRNQRGNNQRSVEPSEVVIHPPSADITEPDLRCADAELPGKLAGFRLFHVPDELLATRARIDVLLGQRVADMLIVTTQMGRYVLCGDEGVTARELRMKIEVVHEPYALVIPTHSQDRGPAHH